ncbi:hypothetical protein ACFQ40_00095 [Kroppenstedtia eburnea]|uniref:DUF7667 family protein n=1 Tax=Kroppenstedtia eburnea TaxID=714067 RepID=UPI0036280BCA
MLLINKIAMLAEIRKVRPLTLGETTELQQYRGDLVELSLIAYQARDWTWLHEICGQLGEIDFILWGERGRP